MNNFSLSRIKDSRILKGCFIFTMSAAFIVGGFFVFIRANAATTVSYHYDVGYGDGADTTSGTSTPFTVIERVLLRANDCDTDGTDSGSGCIQARLFNDTPWPENTYDETKYIEFNFSPNIPDGAIVNEVKITNDYRQVGGTLGNAKLEIWDGNIWVNQTLATSTLSNGDINEVLDITSLVDTPAKVNASKIRFLAYNETGQIVQTGYDFIGLNVVYNFAPVVNDRTVSTNEDTFVSITLSATDADGDSSFTYSIVSPPSNGAATLSGNQATFTPNLNYNGSDSFTYKANDGTADSNTAAVAITITPVNDAPVLGVIGNQPVDELATLNFTATSTDVDNAILTYSLTPTSTGAVINSSTGVFSWTPTEAQGPETYTFIVQVSDGLLTDSEEITVAVSEVNIAPVANDSTALLAEDTPTAILLSVTDADLPANTFTYTINSAPQNGTLGTFNGTQVTYTPNSNYFGLDSFNYTVSDGNGGTASANVVITITPVNDAPVLGLIGNKTADELANLLFTATSTDIDGDTLTYSLTPTSTGAVINSSTGVFSWTPTEAQGPDSYPFTIMVSDGSLTDSKNFTVTVAEVNTPPVAVNKSITTNEDTASSTTLSATDSDIPANTLTYSIVSPPSNGAATLSGNQVTYTPTTNYNGSDSFTYKANDGTADSNIATVAITITAVNDAPVASSTAASTNEDTPVTIILSATDVDSLSLTYLIAALPAHGALSAISGNQVTYTPNANYNGFDYFTFKANDGAADSITAATVNITITPVNDAPLTANKSISATVDNSFSISLPATDVDGDTLTASIISGPTRGSLSGLSGTNVTYTPNGTLGTDTFTFKVNDGTVDSNISTTTITLSPGTLTQLAISASPSSLNTTSSSTITITGKDKFGNTVIDNNSSIVNLIADNGGVLDSMTVTLSAGVKTAALSKFSKGTVNVKASSGSLASVQTSVVFTDIKISKVDPTKTYAKDDNTYENGWRWILDATVPTNETGLSMKFSDWFSDKGDIPVGSNLRIYSPQSSNASSTVKAITITAANTYGNIMVLDNDIDALTSGRQIQIYIEAKVPKDSAPAAYSTMYKIITEEFTLLQTLLQ